MTIILGLLAGLAGLTACTHSPVGSRSGPTRASSQITMGDFWHDQLSRGQETEQISAKVRLSYQGRQGKKISGQGRLVIQADTKLRLELRDPLGRIHYLAALSGRHFVAHYPRQKLAYVDDKSGEAYVLDFLGIDFNFAELHSLLLGRLPNRFSKSAFDTWQFDPADKVYRGLLTLADYRVVATVDPLTAALRHLELSSPAGKIVLEYSVFEPCCHGIAASRSVRIAQVVDLKLDKERTVLAIEWEKIAPLQEARPDEMFLLDIPAQDQKIVLQ